MHSGCAQEGFYQLSSLGFSPHLLFVHVHVDTDRSSSEVLRWFVTFFCFKLSN